MLLNTVVRSSTSSFLPLDAVRQEQEITLTVDVPGVDPATIEVTVDRNVLTVATERPGLTVQDGQRVITAERRAGRQVRRLTLGDTVDTGAITAEVDRGVLTLHLPVVEAAQPRRIEVGAPTAVAVESGEPASA